MILRCTARAAGLLGVSLATDVAAGDDDWYLNLLWVERRKNLLLAHARTAFPIFVPDVRKSDLTPVGPWLCHHVTAALADEALPADALGPVDSNAITPAKTASRQVLGLMNQTALLAVWEIAESGGLTSTDMTLLNRTLRRELHNNNGQDATPLELINRRSR